MLSSASTRGLNRDVDNAGAGPADLILVTHPHSDHFDRRAIAGLSRPDTVVVLPVSCAEQVQTGVSAGQTISFRAARITGVPAYNIQSPGIVT
ncbi:MAG: hypothetical protein ABSB63_03480 [Spirochaetia bacterium]|jgi:L-ascorbate metabolism protein UlaG (beta-lactamase superfamily)